MLCECLLAHPERTPSLPLQNSVVLSRCFPPESSTYDDGVGEDVRRVVCGVSSDGALRQPTESDAGMIGVSGRRSLDWSDERVYTEGILKSM